MKLKRYADWLSSLYFAFPCFATDQLAFYDNSETRCCTKRMQRDTTGASGDMVITWDLLRHILGVIVNYVL